MSETGSKMKLRMDRAGRIVVPKWLRMRLGIAGAAEIEAVEHTEGILLRLHHRRPSMLKVNGLWVHQGVAEPGVNWDQVVDDVREQRIRDVLNLDESGHG